MNEDMKKTGKMIGRKMALRMGLSMSFCLSLVATLASGHFSIPGFLMSFVISSIISIVIGLLVPIRLVNGSVRRKLNLTPEAFNTRCIEAFVSDLIYTPVISLAMTAFARNMAYRQSGGMAQPQFLSMFLSSLFICFITGFVLIFILSPFFLAGIMKKEGIPREDMQGGPGDGNA